MARSFEIEILIPETYIYRKGLVKFVKKKFPKKIREIEDLERSVSVRKTTELKVTVCFAMISTVYI